MKLLYEGKSKRVYERDAATLLIEFKDDVTAMDGALKSSVKGKGVINARVSAYLFRYLEGRGIRTHYIDYDGLNIIVVKRLKIVPIEVIVRNFAYGSLLKRMPLYKPLQKFSEPLVEFHFKDDTLHDPLILKDDIINTGLLSKEELEYIVQTSLRVNYELKELFSSKNLSLIDMKLEFGKDNDGNIFLADEISGDTFRVLDERGRHLDKEIFRKTGDADLMIKAYVELCNRLGIDVSDVYVPG